MIVSKPSDFCCLNFGCVNPDVCNDVVGFSCGDPAAGDSSRWKQPPSEGEVVVSYLPEIDREAAIADKAAELAEVLEEARQALLDLLGDGDLPLTDSQIDVIKAVLKKIALTKEKRL
jgi:hypothetical protein